MSIRLFLPGQRFGSSQWHRSIDPLSGQFDKHGSSRSVSFINNIVVMISCQTSTAAVHKMRLMDEKCHDDDDDEDDDDDDNDDDDDDD